MDFQPALHAEPVEPWDSLASTSIESESSQSLVAPTWMLAALEKMDREVVSELELQE